jgi:hypothetical protein
VAYQMMDQPTIEPILRHLSGALALDQGLSPGLIGGQSAAGDQGISHTDPEGDRPLLAPDPPTLLSLSVSFSWGWTLQHDQTVEASLIFY